MAEPLETIIELREEFMISPVGDSNPIQRTAHFLKPSVTAIDGPASAIPSSSLSSHPVPPVFEPSKWPLTIRFSGWRCPPKKWIDWVDSLHSTYESVWKNVGIYESIMGTKCEILKNEELVLGIAERWCIETNTFIFPWAEATITLEDIMILAGYPVIGAWVFSPPETQELKEIEEKLLLARREAGRTKQRKASTSAWINLFVNSGKDIEHEAFLAAWLSMFVFPDTCLVRKIVFPIAIHLARGIPIALAPAVLASIYRDLTLLKQKIVDLTRSPVTADAEHLHLIIRSPFYLVQMWVWERFESLQPIPKYGEPQFARWHKVKALKIDNVRLVLDSSGEEFLWRPYCKFGGKQKKFYADNGIWMPLDPTLDKELLSYFMCLRVSELVGLDCVKQYLPHRVAMQFGMDQDIPGPVARFNETPDIAWDNYNRLISDKSFYIPSRLFEADITTRYAEWWKQSVLAHRDAVRNIVQGKRSLRLSKHGSQASKAKKSDNAADVPPGFAPKHSIVLSGHCCEDGTSKTKKGDNDVDAPTGFLPKRLKTLSISKNCLEEGFEANNSDDAADIPPGFDPKCSVVNCGNCCEGGTSKTKKGDNDADVPYGFFPKCLKTSIISTNSVEEVSKAKGDNNADVPPGFSPKYNTVDAGNFVKGCKPECLEDTNRVGMSYSPDKVTSDECNHLSKKSQSSSSSTAECGAITKMDSLLKPVVKIRNKTAMEGVEEALQDANQSKETDLAYERVNLLWTGGEGSSYTSGIIITELEERICRLERVVAVLKNG